MIITVFILWYHKKAIMNFEVPVDSYMQLMSIACGVFSLLLMRILHDVLVDTMLTSQQCAHAVKQANSPLGDIRQCSQQVKGDAPSAQHCVIHLDFTENNRYRDTGPNAAKGHKHD